MQGMLATPWAVLFHLQAPLKRLLILLGVVVHMLANRALEVDQIVLGHNNFNIKE